MASAARRSVQALLPALCFAFLAFSSARPANASEALDTWRAEATRVRTLAENNVPEAYAQATRTLHPARYHSIGMPDRGRGLL